MLSNEKKSAAARTEKKCDEQTPSPNAIPPGLLALTNLLTPYMKNTLVVYMMCNKVDLWLKCGWCTQFRVGLQPSNATVQIFHEKSAKMEFIL